MHLPILFQDEHIIAVNKPPGLLVHRSELDRQETRFALQILRDQIGERVYPIHRLDKPTSGVLVFALSSGAASEMGSKILSHEIQKTYLAVVRGFMSSEGVFDDALKLRGRRQKKNSEEISDQEAITEFKTLDTCELPIEVDRFPTSRYSLVQAFPKTGRMHQIRRHFKHAGHPIIGDTTHGNPVHNRFFANHFEVAQMLLTCMEMSFEHPYTNEHLYIKAPLAEGFTKILKELGWSLP